MDKIIRGFGAIDVSLVLMFFYNKTFLFEGGLFKYFSDKMQILFGFDSFYLSLISIAGGVIFFSIFVSGVFMLFLSRFGVYLSLMQAPFRFFLVIPPSFFFIQNVPVLSESAFFSVAMIGVLEVLKVVIQVSWLQRTKAVSRA